VLLKSLTAEAAQRVTWTICGYPSFVSNTAGKSPFSFFSDFVHSKIIKWNMFQQAMFGDTSGSCHENVPASREN
jgi:hypothetical protein